MKTSRGGPTGAGLGSVHRCPPHGTRCSATALSASASASDASSPQSTWGTLVPSAKTAARTAERMSAGPNATPAAVNAVSAPIAAARAWAGLLDEGDDLLRHTTITSTRFGSMAACLARLVVTSATTGLVAVTTRPASARDDISATHPDVRD